MKNYFSLFLLTFFLCVSCNQEVTNTKLNGPIFGTFYDVTYASDGNENHQESIDGIFAAINQSMSNYQSDSDISKVNKHQLEVVDAHFIEVFKAAKKIYKETNGVFDPTIGKLVNAWNFGSEQNKTKLDSLKIDSLMQFVGFEKITLKNNTLIKRDPKPYIDFNAIAKGYAVDLVAAFLESKNTTDYLVNIGGELRAKGINIDKQSGWTVGIENPNFDGTQSYDKVFVLKDKAMATTGTYRKYKLDTNGNRYAHIIDTKTGYPTKTNILSVSVIAEDCMMADGYATAFQAMGVESVKEFLRDHSELQAYIIFENENQEFEMLSLNNFPVK
jgi:thiamine biosynthesis lipoprotein|tara:strand:- start:1442 stop:2431 length:990 start_codon:yes stop_codon:yes gene_type:complete